MHKIRSHIIHFSELPNCISISKSIRYNMVLT
uniref:Uncharacterized protein n=1 Tax=Rhizophora mucronata TaxID=61149 RepID=A0A2P2R1M5_RHIMU